MVLTNNKLEDVRRSMANLWSERREKTLSNNKIGYIEDMVGDVYVYISNKAKDFYLRAFDQASDLVGLSEHIRKTPKLSLLKWR